MIPLVTIKTDAIASTVPALKSLSTAMRSEVIPRALNKTGDVVYTAVKRRLTKTTSIPYGRINKVVSKRSARPGHEVVTIGAKAEATSLKDFAPKQQRKGVRAKVWGRSQLYRRTFIGPGGHVYKRTTGKRLPIEKLFGPVVANELVRKETASIAAKIVTAKYPGHLRHEIGLATGKITKRIRKLK